MSHSAVVDAWRERERLLRARGHDVRTLSARVWDEAGMPVQLVARPGEPVEGVATTGRHPALFLYDPRPLWRALGEPWDVIDVHEEPFALATAQVLLLRAVRARHTPYVLYSAQNLDKRLPLPFRVLQRWALRGAAGVSVCNRAAGDVVVRRGFPGRPQVIALGLDPTVFAPDPARRAPAVGAPIVVGYAGRLAPHKGVEVLLDAMAGQPALVLRIAGAGPDEGALRARVTDAGLTDRVAFIGALGVSQLAEFYRGLDVLAVPSLTTPGWVEQFGRVAVEAMACGIPVVASDSGALPEVVGGAGRLVPPGDAAALGVALVAVGADPQEWSRCREAGLVRAGQATWSAVADRYEDLYAVATHAPLVPPAAGSARPVEVVVVAYGAPDLLARALRSVADRPVTVVDNSSSPDVAEVCRAAGVRYLDPGRNRGFGAGVNVALADPLVPGADVLLLNPDAALEPGALDALSARLTADPTLASVGPWQVDEGGDQARVGWPFPSPWGSWRVALGFGRTVDRVDYAIGSVLLLRAEALAQVGGFDEEFFLYAEETDWAKRAALLGWRHTVATEATALHTGAGTSTDPDRRLVHFTAGLERYVRKHHGPVGWAITRSGEAAGAALRAAALPGPRSRAARSRLRLLLAGPVKRERAAR
ncbi:MAG: glycosyltransferase [Actinomycetales bacterium]|nr:glycosyltransferase [Candidatus Phosphoribacter baldrii]